MKIRGYWAAWGICALTTCVAHGATTTFTASEDATVKKASPTKNFGTVDRLDVDGSGSESTQEAYIKFKVKGVSGAVTSAKVRVYVTDASPDGPGIYRTENSWAETTITWNKRPARGSKIEGKGAVKTGWLEYDVSSVVKGDGTYSFAFAENVTDGTDFQAREGASSTRPQLVVVTQPPAPVDPLANAVFTSVGTSDVDIDGVSYGVQSAEKSHSIRRSQKGRIFRFEVRKGEGRPGKDSGRDRAELSQRVEYKKGTDLWASYSFMLEKGQAITGNPDNVFTQWHGGAGSPPLSIRIPLDKTLFVRSISGKSSDGVNFIPYTMTNFERGKWYHVVQHVVFDSKGRGLIEIWINGKKVVDVRDRSTTYSDSSHNYFKFGIYRSTISLTEVAYYANMEAGTKNLYDRIAHPLPVEP